MLFISLGNLWLNTSLKLFIFLVSTFFILLNSLLKFCYLCCPLLREIELHMGVRHPLDSSSSWYSYLAVWDFVSKYSLSCILKALLGLFVFSLKVFAISLLFDFYEIESSSILKRSCFSLLLSFSLPTLYALPLLCLERLSCSFSFLSTTSTVE